jgi:hypothetical protein
MPLTLEDFVGLVSEGSKGFLKHIDGLTAEQWDWKPYPECKSVRESLIHLLIDDEALKASIVSGKEPDYAEISDRLTACAPTNTAELTAAVVESNVSLCAWLTDRFKDTPLDEEICFFGYPFKLALALAALQGEYQYHTGQVAFIRMASDPTWNYYLAIYGIEE